MRIRLAVLLLSVLVPAAPVAAQPACTAQREGMVACFGEKLCECRWEPGGSMTGRPAGHRWDCGALRPACGVVPPSAGEAQPYPLRDLPPVFLTPRERLPGGGGPVPQGRP